MTLEKYQTENKINQNKIKFDIDSNYVALIIMKYNNTV